MSIDDLACSASKRVFVRRALPLLALVVGLTALGASTARAVGSEWTAQHMVGPPYTGTTFSERFRYVNPQVLPFSDGTAEAIWSEADGPHPGIRGRHLGADATPTADAYDIGYPVAAVGVPGSKVAPLTGSLGVIVMDATISDTQRRIYGQLLGPNGPVGPIFEISAAIGRDAVSDFDVASNGDGTVTVAWPEYDGTALAIKERRVDAAGVSGPVVTVSDPLARPENTNAVNTVEVRGHGDGTASIAWSESRISNGVADLNVRRVGPSGVIGPIHQVATGTRVQPLRIAAHPDGSVTAAWGEASSSEATIYVTRISASGAIGAPEHICELAFHRSRAGMQCLDLAGGPDNAYDVASNGDGSATVVARRPQHEDIASWRVDDLGQATSPTILETVVPDPASRQPQVITGADGSTVALWTGKLPTSDLPALHAAHIGRDNAVIGDQTLFPLADGRGSAQMLAGPAVTGSGAGIPIWSVWSDWTANPADDPTTTRQVYAARYPRVDTPPPPPPPTTCPDVQVVAVRGSRGSRTEPSPLEQPIDPERAEDATVQDFVNRLTDRLKQRFGGQVTVAPTEWIRYDAAWAFWGIGSYIDWGRSLAYNSSVDGGVRALKKRLPDYQGACLESGTQLVLAGYSQGAQIIGRAMDTGMGLTGVKAVALMGDPTFSVEHSGDVMYLPTYGLNPIGTLGARTRDFPAGPKVFGICRPLDAICDSLGGTVATNSIPPEWYPEHGKYGETYSVPSNPWWPYSEQIPYPAPTQQLADKVGHQAIREPQAAAGARLGGRARTSPATRLQSRASAASSDPLSPGPVVVLPQRIVTRPGQPILVPASLSYDPNGSDLRYDWDLDGDGVFERATDRLSLEYSSATPQTVTINLRATNDEGTSTVARSVIEVSSTAPGRPSAPRDPEAVAEDHAVTLTWKPPTDTGGPPVTAYVVRNATTEAFVAQVDGTATGLTLNDRTPGVPVAYTITARTDARTGMASAATPVVVPWEPGPVTPPPPPAVTSPLLALQPPQVLPTLKQFTVGLSVKALRSRQLAARRVLTIKCKLNAAGSCNVRATLSRKDSRRLRIRLKSGAGELTVAGGRATMTKPGWAIVKLKLASSFRRAIRRTRKGYRLRFSANAISNTGSKARRAILIRVRK